MSTAVRYETRGESKRNLFDEEIDIVNASPVLSTPFHLHESRGELVTLVLTSKSVFYHLAESRHLRNGFYINFDCSFQVIRAKKGEEKTLSPPEGLRFMCPNYESVELYSQSAKDIQKWEDQLKNFIKQFDFHELFKAEKRLGKGNFATVYLGVSLKDQRKVAIKAFGKEATFSQQNGKEAMINQVKVTRMFNHPNLMRLQGVYQSNNSVYFALEYIEGHPICSRFNNLLRYTESQRKMIMKGILRGLVEMARRNVIHRDLKPENIILAKEPIIIDFGLATVADEQKYLYVRCGTPGYVAPEIINIKDLDTKSQPISDVFSVGCIFYYIIFSKHLFMGKNGQELINMNRECDLVLTGPQFDKLNAKQVDLLRKMLQKQPQLRITAAEALRHSYFTESDDKMYVPKILMKQSGSCPVDLICNENQAAIKFLTVTDKTDKKESVLRSYDRSSLRKKIEKLDINKMVSNA